MMRHEGIIPVLKKTFIPRRFLFFDTETVDRNVDKGKKRLDFRLGAALYVEYDPDGVAVLLGDHTFRVPGDFVFLLQKYAAGQTALVCVAHNIQFDLQTLDLPYMLSRSGFEMELPILSFAATLWKMRYKTHLIHFMDSMNLFPRKLAELGGDVHVPKIKVSFSHDSDATIAAYCKNDCAILIALFTQYRRFLLDNDLGYFGETIAWQAMNAYRHRFMSVPIHIHTNYEVLAMERKAYHGARCECYRIGELPTGEYTMLDVNSMYPFVMRDKEYPVEFVHSERNPDRGTVSRLLKEYYCIAECEVNTSEPAYPLRTTAKLVFPVGRFTTWLHHCELEHARRQGHVSRVRVILCYRHANLFRDYVEFFDGLKANARQAGHRSKELMIKAFENSLYGKWGQRNHILHKLGKSDRPGVHCEYVGREGVPGLWEEWDWFGTRYSSVKLGERPYSCPSIAGAITAYGRMYLWELMGKAGHENVFYVDTDALLVGKGGCTRLQDRQDGVQLGALKQVWESKTVVIHGPKDYERDLARVTKGVRPDAVVSPQGGFLQERWSHLETQLKRGERVEMTKTPIVKHRTATYDKGYVDDDGIVTPWNLPDEMDRLP